MFSRNTIGSNWSCNWSCNWSYCELCVSLHPWCSGLPEVMNSVFFLKKKVLPVPLTHRLMTTQHKINQTRCVFDYSLRLWRIILNPYGRPPPSDRLQRPFNLKQQFTSSPPFIHSSITQSQSHPSTQVHSFVFPPS